MNETKKFIAAYDTEKSLNHYGHAIYNVKILEAEKFILEKVNLPKNATVADLGSGPGRFGLNLAMLRNDLKIDCYDLSELSIFLGRKLVKEHKLSKNVNFYLADLTKSGIYKQKYDFMFFTFNALMTIPGHKNKQLALKYAYQNLNEGGYLAFTAPTISGDRNREKFFAKRKVKANERLGDLTYTVDNSYGILCYYEYNEVLELLESINLPKPIFHAYRDDLGVESTDGKEFSDNAIYYLIHKKP